MKGGIIAYDGGKAVGDEEFGLEFFVGGDFNDVFRMSYAMEEGLQQLYLVLEEKCEEGAVKQLLSKLAKFEEGHKTKLKGMFPRIPDDGSIAANKLEGGFDLQQIVDHYHGRNVTSDDIIQLGIMLETQAFDLYSRLAGQAEDNETKDFFLFMVNEEKLHLKYLSDEYDRLLQN